MEFGLNLYSVRNLIKTEEDFLKTAHALREMGYDYMQFSGAPLDADMIARVSRESGLPTPLTHAPLERIIGDTDALMEEHAKFGCTRIGVGGMGYKIMSDERVCKDTVEKLNRAAEKMAANGFSFFYHNHHTEFHKYNGQTILDYMIENAPSVNFILDTYWVQYGGASISDYVKKLSGRIECVHLKDYKVRCVTSDDKVRFEPIYAPVGEGNIDFGKLIPEMKAAGTEFFIVEQDNAADFEDSLGEVKRSINYLKENF